MSQTTPHSIVRVNPFGKTELKTITPTSGTAAQMHCVFGDYLEYYFPPGIIDLSSLRFLFTLQRAGTSSTTESLPRDTECCIEHMEVSLGNTVIDSIQDYHMLYFILSTYAMPASYQVKGQCIPRGWTNRRLAQWTRDALGVMTASAGRDLQGVQFCAEQWLGLLGTGALLDTRKWGKLTIRMRLIPQTLITGGVATNIYGMRDPYFRATYLPDNVQTTNTLSFDSFTGGRMSHQNYNSRSTLIVDGRRRLKYVVARPLTVATHVANRAATVHTATSLTFAFLSNGEHVNRWNIDVNSNRINAAPATRFEALPSLQEVFPDGCLNISNGTDSTQLDTVHLLRSWAVGAKLDLAQRENGQQHEISFTIESTSSGAALPMISYIHACHPTVIDVSSGKLVVTE